MSLETDVADSLFKVYDVLQDIMKHHEVANSSLHDLSVCEDDHDFTPVETASAAIISACEKIEDQFKPPKSHCCC